jgi:hypothetical protein
VADELHARARRLRIFAASKRAVDPRGILRLVERKKNEVEGDLAENAQLLDRV